MESRIKELKSQVNDVLPSEYWTWKSDGEIIDIIKDLLEASNDDQEEILKLKEENEKLKEDCKRNFDEIHKWMGLMNGYREKWGAAQEENEELKRELMDHK